MCIFGYIVSDYFLIILKNIFVLLHHVPEWALEIFKPFPNLILKNLRAQYSKYFQKSVKY